jgi:hypothetical protein
VAAAWQRTQLALSGVWRRQAAQAAISAWRQRLGGGRRNGRERRAAAWHQRASRRQSRVAIKIEKAASRGRRRRRRRIGKHNGGSNRIGVAWRGGENGGENGGSGVSIVAK